MVAPAARLSIDELLALFRLFQGPYCTQCGHRDDPGPEVIKSLCDRGYIREVRTDRALYFTVTDEGCRKVWQIRELTTLEGEPLSLALRAALEAWPRRVQVMRNEL